jgi:hypothetical protein
MQLIELFERYGIAVLSAPDGLRLRQFAPAGFFTFGKGRALSKCRCATAIVTYHFLPPKLTTAIEYRPLLRKEWAG